MENLFGKVDNLNMFIHPKYNEKFKFMNEEQSINLAKRVLEEFIKTGYKSIVVIESGTSPLISIIKNLEEYKNTKFKLIQLKIPRNLNFNLYQWFETYLTKEELNKKIEFNGEIKNRKELLKENSTKFNLEKFIGKEEFTIYDSIQDNKNYEEIIFPQILKGTELYEILTNPFLLFDEYINAGTIIRNFNGMVRLFTNKPEFQLSAYCMFLDNPQKYKKIAFTLYDNSTELECYRKGAYPFENRIDLIGYYYFISENHFEKIYLKELNKSLKTLDIKKFYNELERIIIKNNLLDKLKENLEEEQVKRYVTNNDIIRFFIKYLDEKIYGKNKYADFLDQVFELYAPSWSPMPTKFHLDYWNGFGKIKEDIERACIEISKEYKKYRLSIIKYALEKLEENKKEWESDINENYRYFNGIK